MRRANSWVKREFVLVGNGGSDDAVCGNASKVGLDARAEDGSLQEHDREKLWKQEQIGAEARGATPYFPTS